MNTNTKTTMGLYDEETLQIVKENSMRASNEAFEVLASIKDGAVTLTEASEMSNAIGKVNAANANIIKADLLALTIDKQMTSKMKQLEAEDHG